MFIKEIPARISIWCKLDYPNRISIRIRSFFFVKIHFIARQHSIKTVYNVDQNALFPKIHFFFFHHLFSLSHFRDFQSAEPFNTVLYCLLFPIVPQKAKLFDAQQSVKQIKQRLALAMSVHDINHIKCLRILF